ncbi:hypothetical protein NQZ68_031800 [Dissostichus eleginoides]|nr:hypothetical protein NQZ68_031800 [Dissostichus eleginoides]
MVVSSSGDVSVCVSQQVGEDLGNRSIYKQKEGRLRQSVYETLTITVHYDGTTTSSERPDPLAAPDGEHTGKTPKRKSVKMRPRCMLQSRTVKPYNLLHPEEMKR